MVERSYYWDGNTTGDASLAKFNEFIYHSIWRKLFLGDRTVQGVIFGYENECEVVGVSGGVTIDTGVALVDGQFYENDKKLTIDIPIPAASTRIDVIVLRRNPTEQTIRATRIAGTEGAGAPSIIQISGGGTWDLKIAEVSITTAGAITVTDYREYCMSNIMLKHKPWEEIETIITVGGENIITFDDIPDTYTHLVISGVGSAIDAAQDEMYSTFMFFNGDDVAANYNRILLFDSRVVGGAAAIGALSNAGSIAPFILIPQNSSDPYYQGNGIVRIPYYKETDFFKTAMGHLSGFTGLDIAGRIEMSQYIVKMLWENTDAITSISLASGDYFGGTADVFSTNCKFTLYGIK